MQLLYADDKGRMYDHSGLLAAGRLGGIYTEINESETIPLPEGASLVLIPGGRPVGIDAKGNFSGVKSSRPAFAVGALLPQGFTRTLLPAYARQDDRPLPLMGYAAVGWKDGVFRVAAVQTDDGCKWDPVHYSTPGLKTLVEEYSARLPENRIIRQLSKCALNYHCFTAQNIFYKRWEAGIPVSPACNASCLGCISLQPAECCPSPQERISFVPHVEEVVEIALPHLVEAREGIVSFGQGCEGEPALSARVVSAAIERIRRKTTAGTINMNTNAGCTAGIREICLAGIDSLRVSTISAREETYRSYYVPRDYSWQDVCASIAFAREQGVFVSLNLLTFPGLTDLPEEAEAMLEFIQKYDINMVQFRNLNIDPDYLGAKIPLGGEEAMGIGGYLELLRKEVPSLEIGNYSRPVGKS